MGNRQNNRFVMWTCVTAFEWLACWIVYAFCLIGFGGLGRCDLGVVGIAVIKNIVAMPIFACVARAFISRPNLMGYVITGLLAASAGHCLFNFAVELIYWEAVPYADGMVLLYHVAPGSVIGAVCYLLDRWAMRWQCASLHE